MKKLITWVSTAVVASYAAASLFAQGVPAPYTSRLERVYTGLDRPILLKGPHDGSKRIFVLQQSGQIRVFQQGSTTSTVFLDLSQKIIVPTSQGDERGLLGLAFHPNFVANGKFYVFYTRNVAGQMEDTLFEYTTSTGNGNSNTGNPNSERLLFTIPDPFTNHNGGNLEFGPDGFLYIGTGDGGSADDPGNRAQNLQQLLGKMLRIDVNSVSPAYAIPPGNPFAGAGSGRCDGGSTAGTSCQEIWSYGMRNPWRWSFDRGGTHQLYVADVGQNAIEELDIIQPGGNYGWRVYEGNQCNTNIPGNCPTTLTQTPPFFTYTHASGRCSVTGGYVYRGAQGNLPPGAYVYGDYCSGEIWMYLSPAQPQVLLQDTPRNVVSFGEDDDGEIYVCYSNVSGSAEIDKIVRSRASSDFDGDLRTDIAVYRPSNGIWYISHSSNGSNRYQNFGLAEDIPVPEDYDGDNVTDIGVFRPSTGAWYNFRSSDNTVGIVALGASGDVPVATDLDGDAKSDYAVFRPSTGIWSILYSRNPATVANVNFGLNGDIPTASDFDGDGISDIAIFRPSTGDWWWIPSNAAAGSGFSVVHWGLNGDIPVAGDFDGDFKADQAVFRPSSGLWFVRQSSNGVALIGQWGLSADIPVVGDYDGDGKDDIAVFRPSTGVWYIVRSSNGTFLFGQWGLNGDLPTPKFDAP